VKDHPFFTDVDWNQVYLQKYPPPLIPPRGEVNAADAFDIGSFDEEDTKGIKVTNISATAVTRGQSNLTKSASRGAHSPVRGHPRGSKVVPLNSWGRVSY